MQKAEGKREGRKAAKHFFLKGVDKWGLFHIGRRLSGLLGLLFCPTQFIKGKETGDPSDYSEREVAFRNKT